MSENPNIVAWDESSDEEDPDRDVEVNGVPVDSSSGGDGADASASYVTQNSESELDNSIQHQDLPEEDLHAPAEHDNSQHTTNYSAEGHDHTETDEVAVPDAGLVENYVGDGDDAGRVIYVIAAGASDPAEADSTDLIMEEE